MNEHDCSHSKDWGKQEQLNERLEKHLYDSDKEGGYRDRVAKLEVGMRIFFSSGKWFITAACVGGFLGGLLGKAVPDFLNWIVNIK